MLNQLIVKMVNTPDLNPSLCQVVGLQGQSPTRHSPVLDLLLVLKIYVSCTKWILRVRIKPWLPHFLLKPSWHHCTMTEWKQLDRLVHRQRSFCFRRFVYYMEGSGCAQNQNNFTLFPLHSEQQNNPSANIVIEWWKMTFGGEFVSFYRKNLPQYFLYFLPQPKRW